MSRALDARPPGQGERVSGDKGYIQALLVEDNPGDARLILELLRDVPEAGVRLEHVTTVRDAKARLKEGGVDVVLVDLGLPDADGIKAVEEVHDAATDLPIVVLTGRDDMTTAHHALEEGAQDYLVKGRVDGELLSRCIQYAIDRNRRRLEHEEMTAQMAQVQHMAALGTLAASVAHEINNPLTYIQLNLELVMDRLKKLQRKGQLDDRMTDELSGMSAALDMVRQGTDVVESIVRDLKTFTSSASEELQPTDVVAAVEWAVKMARHQVSSRAHVDKQIDEVPRAWGNEVRVGQVVLNLLLNTHHAFDSQDPYHNRIDLRVWHEDGEVRIQVRDNGKGMPESVRNRVFEPFFTTRAGSDGTGLGLFVCRNAVRHMGGTIDVDSELGRGTTFLIRLPTADAATDEVPLEPLPTDEDSGEEPLERDRRRVLVIDDDALVRKVLERALQEEYEVVTVSNARDGIELFCEDDGFDVVLCDLIMPDIDGAWFYEQVVVRCGDRRNRVLFMTGGASTPRAVALVGRVENEVLEKPFRIDEVRQAVERVCEVAGR